MAVNKVIYGNRVIIDISGSTVTPETLAEGVIAFNAKGERIVGTARIMPAGYTAFIDSDGLTFMDANGDNFMVKER